MRLIGYARVSTDDQNTAAQLDALRASGCKVIYEEHASGADRARPELARALADVRAGDTLVVTRIDRLARSARHLYDVLEHLRGAGAAFHSIGEHLDTSTPQGVFTFQILGAVAELERNLIASRTKAGIAAAKARGARPGNPGVRARNKAALEKVAAGRHATRLTRVISSVDTWLPTVRRMRPKAPWADVVAALNKDPAGRDRRWNVERLKRAVRLLVDEHMADAVLLGRAPRRPANPQLSIIIAAIRLADPKITLSAIARLLETQNIKSPRGHARWTPSMVAAAERTPAPD